MQTKTFEKFISFYTNTHDVQKRYIINYNSITKYNNETFNLNNSTHFIH